MKIRVLAIIFVFMISIGCIGCAPENEINLLDTYYFYINDGVLMKLNAETGKSTAVCIDPICDHKEDCPFSFVSAYTVDGDTVYFSRSLVTEIDYVDNEPYIKEVICSYSYRTGEAKVLCEMQNGTDSSLQGFIEVCDDYVYFYKQTPDINVLELTLHRVPCKGGDPESMEISREMWHVARHGDTLYYTDAYTNIYTIDMNSKKETDIVTIDEPAFIIVFRNNDGVRIFYTLKKEDSCELWAYNRKTKSNEKLYENSADIYNVLINNDKLYFMADSQIYALADTGEAELIYGDKSHNISYFNRCGEYLVIKEKKAAGDEFVLINPEE